MTTTNSILAVGSIALDTLETTEGNRTEILGGSSTYFGLAASFGLLIPILCAFLYEPLSSNLSTVSRLSKVVFCLSITV